ncbi:MAG TPA: hypothetical protein VLG37_04935 [Candidatus Saccharimonadales bacterium]|nr:hypothetical protein [Candidatus Saccharimonadales bacterium]
MVKKDEVQGALPEEAWEFKPGDVVAPGPPTSPPSANAQEARTEPEPAAPPTPDNGKQGAETPILTSTKSDGFISWTASEFVAHSKSLGWYLALAVAAAVLAGTVWLLTKDIISAVVVVVGAGVLGFYGARQPRQLSYSLDESGLNIGDRHYAYSEFRSFSIIPEGAFSSVALTPLKRFAPMTTIYYDPADEDEILGLLSERLPLEDRRRDAIDRFLWRIRY